MGARGTSCLPATFHIKRWRDLTWPRRDLQSLSPGPAPLGDMLDIITRTEFLSAKSVLLQVANGGSLLQTGLNGNTSVHCSWNRTTRHGRQATSLCCRKPQTWPRVHAQRDEILQFTCDPGKTPPNHFGGELPEECWTDDCIQDNWPSRG